MEKIKVLAITNEVSGSHFHRINYPLNKINGLDLDGKQIEIEFKKFDQDVLKGEFDILVFHWSLEVSVQELGQLQAKGVKILYSVDDFWQFSDTHPYYTSPIAVNYVQNMVIQNLLLADAVMVTTERLALQVMKYNTNVAILPNFLDPADYSLVKTESDKLRIGLLGSVSHVPDWKLLKGVINRIAKNKEIAEKCEFYICGVDESDPAWKEVIKMFTVKKNLKVVIKNSLPVDRYMELYNDIDVVLLPLESTEFNVCKSALKLMECTISKTIPVGSILYTGKELKGIAVAESALQYEETILRLLDKTHRDIILNHIVNVNLKDADFQKRFENTKSLIGALVNEDLSPKIDNLDIYSVVYDENQIVEYTKYDNSAIRILEQKSWRFEYNPIIDILSKENKEYIGVFSWKFLNKTGIMKNILLKTLQHKKFEEYEFINLSRRYWKTTKEYLEFSYNNHPKLEELLKRVLLHLGKEYNFDKENYTYSNFFIMKTENYKEYVEKWVIPALEFMENDKEYFEDANYVSGIAPEKLKEMTGLDHYTFHTFVLERLICFYLHEKQLKILNIV